MKIWEKKRRGLLEEVGLSEKRFWVPDGSPDARTGIATHIMVVLLQAMKSS